MIEHKLKVFGWGREDEATRQTRKPSRLAPSA
jgi:hypothetical protein